MMYRRSALTLSPPSAELQVRFWARLHHLRSEYLAESLTSAIRSLDLVQIDQELARFVGGERLGALAVYSLRGETMFPVPCLLRAKPLLLGYYRLLYGLSQKEFYKPPFGRFKPLEAANRLSPANEALLVP